MAALVSFVQSAGIGAVHARGVRRVRVTESLALNATTTASALDGEIGVVANNEASMIRVAWGTAPDAAAAAETASTSAGVGVPAGGVSDPIVLAPGEKINVKAA